MPEDPAKGSDAPGTEGSDKTVGPGDGAPAAEDTPNKTKTPAPPPLGEYDSAAGSGKTVAQAALEGAQTDLDTSQAASEQAEAKLETAQAELDKGDEQNVEPPATGRRPASPFYSPDEWRLILWTFGIGFLGGGFACILGFAGKGEPFYATMLSGGMAAVIAVFFLARTDTDKRIHLTIFALLCGFIGSPLVREAVSSFGKGFGVNNSPMRSLQASNDLADDLKNKVTTPEGREEVAGDLRTIEKSVRAAIEDTANEDPSVKSAVAANVEKTVNTLQQIAPAAPTETLRAVENIGVSAAANGQTKVAEQALSAARQLTTNKAGETRKAAAATVAALNRVLKIKPRIHLEVSPAVDLRSLSAFKSKVDPTGYELVGPQITPVPDDTAQVIYYDGADEEEAKYLVDKLTELGVLKLARQPQKREKPANFRPRHFDLQLGANTLPPPP